jgi:glutathione S-transferase
MNDGTRIELFSARICPYAHRTRLVLMEKDVDFELTEIDLKNKPQRFLDISLYGKVPAMVHDGVEVYESAVINEYLEEVFPEPAFMPREPSMRAALRIWVEYCNNRFLDDYYAALKSKDSGSAQALQERVVAHFQFMENFALARLSDEGPYWLGKDVSLLDFAYFPFFERLPAWEHYRGIGIPDDCKRLKRWHETMRQRPVSVAIANSAEYYVEHYASYATGKAA